MSTGTRLPLVQAEPLATALADLLRGSCVRIEIAGSIRRRKPDIGDLELVAIPRLARQTDLFGEETGEVTSLLEERVAWLLERGSLAPRLTTDGQQRLGARYKALTYCGLNVDLFIVTAETWGVQFTIRTGPAAFSKNLVTPRQQGGLLPNHLRVREGRLWGSDGQPLETPTEQAVFAALGLAWIDPEARR